MSHWYGPAVVWCKCFYCCTDFSLCTPLIPDKHEEYITKQPNQFVIAFSVYLYTTYKCTYVRNINEARSSKFQALFSRFRFCIPAVSMDDITCIRANRALTLLMIRRFFETFNIRIQHSHSHHSLPLPRSIRMFSTFHLMISSWLFSHSVQMVPIDIWNMV